MCLILTTYEFSDYLFRLIKNNTIFAIQKLKMYI